MIRKVIQLLIVVIIFFFLGKMLYHDWGEISSYQWEIEPIKLFLSTAGLLIAHFFGAFGWNRILRRIGAGLDYTQGMAIWFISILGRYLPGTIWSAVGRIYMCEREGISKSKTGVSVILEQSYMLITGMVVFLFSLAFWHDWSSLKSVFSAFLICPVLLIFLHPRPLTAVLNPILRWMKRDPLVIDVSFYTLFKTFIFYLGYWVVFGIAFYCFIDSIYKIEFSKIVITSGIFAISFVIGYLAIAVPSGLGVREGVLSLLLSNYMPPAAAIIISLGSRVWITLVELIGIALMFLFHRKPLNDVPPGEKIKFW
ncbi:MAG: flippase-like domain-containing protein [Deltaproteobacteria bacterium]|nr:MAG: flippase-like domain-containing protein [Deltaproteobacteria bacterium]